MRRACPKPGCGALVSTGYLCQLHQRRRRELYNWSHVKRSRETREAQPWCSLCGATSDLTADHILPGNPASRLRTMCRSCNSTRANRGRR